MLAYQLYGDADRADEIVTRNNIRHPGFVPGGSGQAVGRPLLILHRLEDEREGRRRGYRLAADHRLAAEHGLTLLFATAAERFAVMRDALNDVSDRLLFPQRTTPERVLRQVRQAMLREWGG